MSCFLSLSLSLSFAHFCLFPQKFRSRAYLKMFRFILCFILHFVLLLFPYFYSLFPNYYVVKVYAHIVVSEFLREFCTATFLRIDICFSRLI